MPIKGLKRDERSVPRAGIIRLGYNTRYCQKCKYKLSFNEPDTTTCPRCHGEMGKQTPTEASHFVLKDAPGAAEALGTDTPTELKIYFPFDDIDRNFPTYRTLFSASSMLCQGDGQHILHAINPQTGQATVKDGLCILPFGERMAHGEQATHKPGDKMPCPALGEPAIYAKCAHCVNRGILLVMLQAVPRMAYFQISTGSIVNLQDLPQQMLNIQELIYELTGKRKLAGVPFILRRVLRSMSPLKKDRQGNPQGRVRVDKYVLQLEIEPEYMISLIRAQRRLIEPVYALAAGQPIAPTVEVIDSPSIISEPPRWEPYHVEEGEFEDEPQPQPEPEPKPQPTNGKPRATLSPLELKEALAKKVAKSSLIDPETTEPLPLRMHPVGDKTANLIRAKFVTALGGDAAAEEQYHAALNWLFGVSSASKLTAPQAEAVLDWLVGKDNAVKRRLNAPLIDPAPAEARAVYVEATKAAGQAALLVAPQRDQPEADDQAKMFETNELDQYFPRHPGGAAYAD